MIPWFLKFISNTSKNKMMHTARNMHQILDLALPAYDELFEEINLDGLVENKGILYIWNDKDLKSRELEINVRNELGVKQQLVSKSEIHDLEPHIKPFYHAGVYYPYARHARNPKKILLKFFELFKKKKVENLKRKILMIFNLIQKNQSLCQMTRNITLTRLLLHVELFLKD